MSALSLPHPLRPYALNRDTAPAFWALGILWLPLATGMQTGNRLVLLEQDFAAGPGPAAHYHPYDEGFYILEGAFTFRAGGGTYPAGPGTFVHIPRLVPHSFTVDAGPARALNFYPSAGFDLLIMSLGQPAPARRIPTLAEAPLPPHDQVDILFKLFGHTDVRPSSGPPQAADYATQPAAWSPSAVYLTTAEQSPTYAALGSQWTLLAGSAHTAGSYALLEQVLPARATTAPQRHAEAEALYVLAGTLRLVLDEQVLEAPAGTFVFIPAGTVHALTAGAEPARFLDFYLPGGFERGITDFGSQPAEPGEAAATAPGADIQTFFDQAGTQTIAVHPPA